MISIIVPVYNAEKYLDRCIQSILAQTYTDFELLLVNDGSTDSSGVICDKYAGQDSRIRVFHKENGGVSSARNWGLNNAEGEYVMFVDSDDYMKFDMCDIMYKTITQKQSDIVICGTEESGGGFWRPNADIDYTRQTFSNNFSSLLQTELLSPPWNKIFKRDKIKTRFREDISFGEDLIFNLQYLALCETLSFIENAPYFHEKDNDSSIVVRFQRNRLHDIEKVWCVIDEFITNATMKSHQKYFRDIIVYVRLLFKSQDYNWNSKLDILNEWYCSARLRNLRIAEYTGVYLNKFLLKFVQLRQWELANLLVNWRKILHLN